MLFVKHPVIALLLVSTLLMACGNEDQSNSEPTAEAEVEVPGQLTITTKAMDFQSRDTIDSGWNTIHYQNRSDNSHFVIFEKYPEGKHLADAERDVVPVFQSAMDSINMGNDKAGFAEFSKLPEWFQKVQFTGGAGLIHPGGDATVTINLEPGDYVLECYVKNPDGKFHSAMGMVKEIHVRDRNSGASPPMPTDQINISSTKGFTFNDNISAGDHVFAVKFEDQKVYENFLGHDVHVVRLTDSTSNNEVLENWMNWVNKDGLISPVPSGFEFVGGLQDLPAGQTGYFSVNLPAGKYALVAEVPEPAKKNMLKVFTVQ